MNERKAVEIGATTLLGASGITILLPFINAIEPKAGLATGVIALGLWAGGVIALRRPLSNTSRSQPPHGGMEN
jgi:hypothetical protein